MISRQTIFSFLLTLLVGLGVFAWNGSKRDECDLAGPDRARVVVPVGQAGRKVLVASCSEWLPRQPAWVQGCCFLNGALAVVFVVSLAADVVSGNRWRAQWKEAQWRR